MKVAPINIMSVENILSGINDKEIILDVYCQRTNNQWSNEQKSLLIHSVLANYPIPPIYFFEKDNIKYLFDGLQRATALQEFSENKLKLHKNTPNFHYFLRIDGENKEGIIELAGKKYEDFQKDEIEQKVMRKFFMSQNISFFVFSECSEEEQAEVFKRLNNGTVMSAAQKNMANLTKSQAEILKEIKNMPLFTKYCNLSSSQKKKNDANNIILQLAMLFNNYPCNKFTPTQFDIFSKKIRRGEFDLNKSYQAFKDLSECIPIEAEKISSLSKYQILIFAYHTITAKQLNIPLEEYGKWMVSFLTNSNNIEDYKGTKNINQLSVLRSKLNYIENELKKVSGDIK